MVFYLSTLSGLFLLLICLKGRKSEVKVMVIQRAGFFVELWLRAGYTGYAGVDAVVGAVVPEALPAVLPGDRAFAALENKAVVLLGGIIKIGHETPSFVLAAARAVIVLQRAVEG
jgi:hypothetical protein